MVNLKVPGKEASIRKLQMASQRTARVVITGGCNLCFMVFVVVAVTYIWWCVVLVLVAYILECCNISGRMTSKIDLRNRMVETS